MATKTKKSAKEKTPVTPVDMLDLLASKYTFGPFRDKQIKDLLAAATLAADVLSAVAAVRTAPVPADPLLTVPPFVLRGGLDRVPHEQRLNSTNTLIYLGHVYDYPASIVRNVDGRVTFKWGCARERSARDAHRHWSGGISRRSGASRPDAEALLTWVEAICRHRGWTW